jgi:hypothetical protein
MEEFAKLFNTARTQILVVLDDTSDADLSQITLTAKPKGGQAIKIVVGGSGPAGRERINHIFNIMDKQAALNIVLPMLPAPEALLCTV